MAARRGVVADNYTFDYSIYPNSYVRDSTIATASAQAPYTLS